MGKSSFAAVEELLGIFSIPLKAVVLTGKKVNDRVYNGLDKLKTVLHYRDTKNTLFDPSEIKHDNLVDYLSVHAHGICYKRSTSAESHKIDLLSNEINTVETALQLLEKFPNTEVIMFNSCYIGAALNEILINKDKFPPRLTILLKGSSKSSTYNSGEPIVRSVEYWLTKRKILYTEPSETETTIVIETVKNTETNKNDCVALKIICPKYYEDYKDDRSLEIFLNKVSLYQGTGIYDVAGKSDKEHQHGAITIMNRGDVNNLECKKIASQRIEEIQSQLLKNLHRDNIVLYKRNIINQAAIHKNARFTKELIENKELKPNTKIWQKYFSYILLEENDNRDIQLLKIASSVNEKTVYEIIKQNIRNQSTVELISCISDPESICKIIKKSVEYGVKRGKLFTMLKSISIKLDESTMKKLLKELFEYDIQHHKIFTIIVSQLKKHQNLNLNQEDIEDFIPKIIHNNINYMVACDVQKKIISTLLEIIGCNKLYIEQLEGSYLNDQEATDLMIQLISSAPVDHKDASKLMRCISDPKSICEIIKKSVEYGVTDEYFSTIIKSINIELDENTMKNTLQEVLIIKGKEQYFSKLINYYFNDDTIIEMISNKCNNLPKGDSNKLINIIAKQDWGLKQEYIQEHIIDEELAHYNNNKLELESDEFISYIIEEAFVDNQFNYGQLLSSFKDLCGDNSDFVA